MDSAHSEFGEFRLDLARRELSRAGSPLRIGNRAMDVLAILAAAKGGVVSKDELLSRVWPGLVVEENNLQVQISALRKILDKDNAGQSYLVTVPGRGYCLASTAAPPTGPALPDKPSIAVLPFQNMSDDPQQDFFADGIVEDITTALCNIRWLFVIARNSSFAYKGKGFDVKQIGRELGVRYVLEGGVRKAGQRVRITAQLIEASSGTHLWANNFDGDLDNVFDLQDQVTASVVGAISPRLEEAEIERVHRKPTESLDAYEFYLRGLACVRRVTRDATEEALQFLRQSIELDPRFAAPYGVAAFCYVSRKMNSWMSDPVDDIAKANRFAWRAAKLGQDDAAALSLAGLALGYVGGDHDGGIALIDRALALNPNLATAWYASGTVRAFRGGEPDVVIEHVGRAMRLSPLDPFLYSMQGVTAFAHFFAGRYDEACLWAEKAFWQKPDILATLRVCAISLAFSGRAEEASKCVKRLLELDPTMRISNLNERAGPFRRPEDAAKYAEGLRRAGLPE